MRLNPWWLWSLPALVACAVFWPALGAGFTGDDWTILALARHGSGPWSYLLADHTIAYSWRPLGMTLWWISAALFADQPFGHYLVNLALHAGAALAIVLLALRLDASRPAALVAGVLFAAHPAAVGTALWLSDRYDLLGTLGALLTLAILVRDAPATTRRLLALLAAGLLAAASKETAFAVLPAAWLWLLLQRPPQALRLGAVVALPFAIALLARLLVFGGSGLGQLGDQAGGVADYAGGALRWLALLPEVVAGRGASGFAVLVLLAAAVGLLLSRRSGGWTRERVAALAALLMLALLPALLQAPITRLALAIDDPLSSITNHRFYHLALAALLAALAVAWSRATIMASTSETGNSPLDATRAAARDVLALVLLAALALPWGWAAWRSAENWRRVTAAPERLALNAAAVATARAAAAATHAAAAHEVDASEAAAASAVEAEPGSAPPGASAPCVVQLLGGSQASEDLPGFVDSLVKAQLAPGERALDCIVLAEAAPWVVLTGPLLPRLPEGFSPRGHGALFDSRAVLGMVVHFPDLPESATRISRWRWDGERFVREGDATGVDARRP